MNNVNTADKLTVKQKSTSRTLRTVFSIPAVTSAAFAG